MTQTLVMLAGASLLLVGFLGGLVSVSTGRLDGVPYGWSAAVLVGIVVVVLGAAWTG